MGAYTPIFTQFREFISSKIHKVNKMEPRIKDRFNEKILAEAMRRYGIAEGRIHLLDGFESFMYEFDWIRGGAAEAGILRIGHSLRRTPSLIQAEVDWINYLAQGGAGVAQAWLSARGSLVEAVQDGQGGQFLVTAFAKARGNHPWKEKWTPAFFERYGRLIGRMHALSQRYAPPHPGCVRYHWDAAISMSVAEFLPSEDRLIAAHFDTLLSYLRALPRSPEGYGLIHQDAHGNNLFVDEAGQITLFDFDDCCYGHYIYDLAMVIFYAIVNHPDMPAATHEFLPPFLQGYRHENSLNPAWFKEIPYFLKLREIDLYAVIHRSWGPGPYEGEWTRNFMHGRKERLDAGLPFVDFDFQSLG
jgi:Ser/Thr protein kinase RdoA (MazF antagonist)